MVFPFNTCNMKSFLSWHDMKVAYTQRNKMKIFIVWCHLPKTFHVSEYFIAMHIIFRFFFKYYLIYFLVISFNKAGTVFDYKCDAYGLDSHRRELIIFISSLWWQDKVSLRWVLSLMAQCFRNSAETHFLMEVSALCFDTHN